MLETREIIIESGRDEGKRFKIAEMNAFEAEELLIEASRIFSKAAGKSKVKPNLPQEDDPYKPENSDNAVSSGMALLGIYGNVDKADLKYITDKIMKQVVYIDDEGKPRKLESAGIKDFTTLLRLKKEVVALHISFLPQDGLLGQLTREISQRMDLLTQSDLSHM